ncbi:MAG: glycosyltransferase, partial [Actinobacteria bacterium]|nr:glycosyltransferase [Actinomycetota bacterium]
MRLLFVLDQWPELSETFIVNELQALRRLGHVVRVQARQVATNPNPEAPIDVDVSVMAQEGCLARARDLAWLVCRRPRSCALDLLRRTRWRRQEWVRPLRSLAVEARRINARGDEHLHAHFAAGAALDGQRLAALTGLPFTLTAHAFDIFRDPRNLREKLETADAVFSGCDYNVEHLRALAPGAAIHKVIMGVDAEAFRRLAPQPDGRTVLAVGRLVEKKGFHLLLDAIAQVPDVRLRIIGEGPMRRDLMRRAQRTGAMVELLGMFTPAQVCAALEQADVLAMPCIVARDGDRDSMPVVVKEAMAMELLVVASDAVGLPECVRAPWGFTAPAGDVAALAQQLVKALALEPGDRRRAGARAREWVTLH